MELGNFLFQEGHQNKQKFERTWKFHTHFTLYKAYMETSAAVHELAKLLHKPNKLFK